MLEKIFGFVQRAIYKKDKESEKFLEKVEKAKSAEDLDRLFDEANGDLLQRNAGLIEEAYSYFDQC